MADRVLHTGRVIDESGSPLVGAHVVLASPGYTPRGTITDFDGDFTINGFENERWEIGFLGKNKIAVVLKKGMAHATYVLKSEATELEGVTVTASKKQNRALAWFMGIVGAAWAAKKFLT